MSKLIDKLAVLLLSVTAFSFSELYGAPVVGLLISLMSTSLVMLFTGTATATVLILGFSVSCIAFPIMLCALPIMLYDAIGEKKPWLVIPAAAALTRISELTSAQIAITAVGSVVALIFRLRVSSLEDSVKKLSELRDEVEGKNRLLSDTNRRIAEAQDNEVHLATLRERNRIAREIHDNVGHMLTRSLLQSGALMIINKDENLKEPLSELKDTLNTAMTSIRESVHDLHDESIDFDAVVRESIRSAEDKFSISYENDCKGDLPVRIRLCFLAIIKEGISNAVKHSNGDRIAITVRNHPAFYQLMIEDNGRCSSSTEQDSDGIGLQNMRDRAAAIGGMISFTPSENGFRIFMTVKKAEGVKKGD